MTGQVIPKSCDVVVIGGGPAGSSAAALLARAGYHVVVLEKERHPRNTVGESIIPHFWKFADFTGAAPKIEAAGFIAKGGGITVWQGRIHQFAFANFGYVRPALHVERDLFDHLLLRHAEDCGAQVFEQSGADRVDFSNPEQPRVVYRRPEQGAGWVACRVVVDASGHATLLARQLNKRRRLVSQQKFLSLWGYFKNARYIGVDGRAYGPEQIGQVRPVTLVLSYESGWIWHIILRESTSVGLVINTDRVKSMGKAEQVRYFLEVCGRVPYLKELLAPASFVAGSLQFRPDYSYYSEQVCGEGFYCIGDAGAFVDPIFSHGVQAAFYNACLCAWAITAGFRHPARRDFYRRYCETRIQQYYGFSRSLALGDLGGEGVDRQLVIDLMRSMSPNELEMMLVASGITDRSANFRSMAREAGVLGGLDERYVSPRARILDRLDV